MFEPDHENLGQIQMEGNCPGSVFSQLEGALPSKKPRSSQPKTVQSNSGFGVSAKKSLMKKIAFAKPFILPVILGVGLSLIATTFRNGIGLINHINPNLFTF